MMENRVGAEDWPAPSTLNSTPWVSIDALLDPMRCFFVLRGDGLPDPVPPFRG